MPANKKTQTIWIFPKDDPAWIKKIVDEFQIHSVTAQILASKGFNTLHDIHRFLYAKLPNLHDPNLFLDMDKAVKRIVTAIKKNEKILVYGDNDVDGMTAAALLVEHLKRLGGNPIFFIPNRNAPLRSFIQEALKHALDKECTLLITVDCGITPSKEIEKLIKNQIDVIITDHHEPTDKIPHCLATLNPKLLNSPYPNRDLTGVGVAFKLAHALTNYLIEIGSLNAKEIDLKDYLDLVALGTISDMGALQNENRILVRYGLKQLQTTKRIGLAKLCIVSELEPIDLTPIDIASKVAPRLNSLGRIADPHKGVELLLIKEEKGAEELAKKLDLYNLERQQIERKAASEIELYFQDNPNVLKEKAIVLHSPNWHPGIIAILSAKIAKLYNRPTIIISIDRGVGKGSIRTIPEFPLFPLLRQYAEDLINFGGHDFAAGLTIKEEKIPAFKKKFIQIANERLKDQDITTKLYLDAQIDFTQLTFDFMESLSLLEPFGNGNASPLLYCDVKQVWPPKVVGKSHLKFFLEQNDRMLEGIGFNMAQRKGEIRKKDLKLKIAFTPYVNLFLNKASIQLQIKDFLILT